MVDPMRWQKSKNIGFLEQKYRFSQTQRLKMALFFSSHLHKQLQHHWLSWLLNKSNPDKVCILVLPVKIPQQYLSTYVFSHVILLQQPSKYLVSQSIIQLLINSITLYNHSIFSVLMQHTHPATIIQISEVIFDISLPSTLITQALSNQNIVSLCKEQKWSLEHQKYYKNSWHHLFPFILSVQSKELFLYGNKHSNIIMDISKIRFSHLTILELSDNNITSIEKLQFLDVPLLQNLCLDTNRITKVSGLNKCGWKYLKSLDLSWNLFDQIEISRLKASMIFQQESNQDEISQLWIEHPSQNLGGLAKLILKIKYWTGNFEINHRQYQAIQRKFYSMANL